MADLLSQYMTEYEKLKDLDKDEDIIKARKRRDQTRLLETIGSIGDDLQKLGTLGGVAPKTDMGAHFGRQRAYAEQDLRTTQADKWGKRKDLLERMHSLREQDRLKARDEKEEERYQRRMDRQTKQDEIDKTYKEGMIAARQEERKRKQQEAETKAARLTSHEEKQKEAISTASNSYNNLKRNIDNLKKSIAKHGTVDIFGPERADKKRMIHEIALDFTKSVEPDSVVQPSEYAAARENLLGTDWSSPQTALRTLEKLEESVDRRYGIRKDQTKKDYPRVHKALFPEPPPITDPKDEAPESAPPVMTRSDKKSFIKKVKATDVGDTFEFNGITYMITDIGEDGQKEIAEM